jgi:hypothetical protein
MHSLRTILTDIGRNVGFVQELIFTLLRRSLYADLNANLTTKQIEQHMGQAIRSTAYKAYESLTTEENTQAILRGLE